MAKVLIARYSSISQYVNNNRWNMSSFIIFFFNSELWMQMNHSDWWKQNVNPVFHSAE